MFRKYKSGSYVLNTVRREQQWTWENQLGSNCSLPGTNLWKPTEGLRGEGVGDGLAQ